MNPSRDPAPPSPSSGPSPSRPVDRWRLRTRTLTVGRVPLLMGVVNVTPDSFSDGGRFFEPAAAIEHGRGLVDQGADVLDIGGQSTRPGAEPVSVDEELRRVMPVVEDLCRQAAVPVSIDTSKAAVAREAIAAGAEVINDITAMTGDPDMLPLAVDSGVGVCAMHMLGEPQTMQDDPTYDDVVQKVLDYLGRRRAALTAAGIDQARIALDPGIGFGKTTGHNLQLLSNVGRLHALGCPLLVGPSRKRFIGRVLGDSRLGKGVGNLLPKGPEGCSAQKVPDPFPPFSHDRTAGTIGVALALARHRVQVLRVHDVAAVRQALLLFEAAGG